MHKVDHKIFTLNATEDQLAQHTKSEIPLDKDLANKNMVMEITSSDQQKFLTYYSNQLKVNVLEQFGELKVTHATTGESLPRTYVKVFYQKK